MDIVNKLASYAKNIQKHTAKTINGELKSQALKSSPTLNKYFKTFANTIAEGKCLRGFLVLLGYQLANKKNTRQILDIAVAVETVHSALLAQDDIMDKSPLRRGKPSIYQALGGNHFGISQAMCLGDLGQQLAIKIILKSNFSNEQKQKALELFTETIINTIYGQMLDEHYTKQKPKTEKEILKMYHLKTAQYTFINPLVLGYLFGNGKKLKPKLENFGQNLGIAYQIQDDILGIFGQEKTLGKSTISDIKEGKNTLLYLYSFLAASKSERETFNCYYGNEKLNDAQAQQIKNLMQKYALKKCQMLAKKYTLAAKKIIPKFSNLCDFLINRDK